MNEHYPSIQVDGRLQDMQESSQRRQLGQVVERAYNILRDTATYDSLGLYSLTLEQILTQYTPHLKKWMERYKVSQEYAT